MDNKFGLSNCKPVPFERREETIQKPKLIICTENYQSNKNEEKIQIYKNVHLNTQ